IIESYQRAVGIRVPMGRYEQYVVVYFRVGGGPRQVYHRRKTRVFPRYAAAVVHAHVVSHDGARVTHAGPRACAAIIAYQYKPALVVMAVVVLDDRVAAIPVGIKTLGIPRCFVLSHLVELHVGVVTAPRPYPRGRFAIGQQPGAVAHHVPFNQRRIAANGYDAIARHPFQQVMADDDVPARVPVVAAPIAIDEDTVAVGPLHGVMFDGEPLVPRRGFAAAILDDDARTAACFLHQTSVHVVDV